MTIYKMKLTIVTYNILADPLCNETSYSSPNYTPSDVDPEKRFGLLIGRLQEFINDEAVICLQEVTKDMSCKLQLFFEENGYQFFSDHYGHSFNGYMGVAIALSKKIKVTRLDKYRLADCKEWPKFSNRPDFLYRWSYGFLGSGPIHYNEWHDSKSKMNTMVSIELNGMVTLSCVHLPCSYTQPSTMLTYVALARLRAQTFAQNKPFILTGDFNVVPGTEMYENLTQSKFDITPLLENYPPVDQWNPNVLDLQQLYSACKVSRGVEPPYTCNSVATIKNKTIPFTGTLDYILVSEDVQIDDAGVAPRSIHSYTDKRLCPSCEESSDHVPVFAIVTVLPMPQ